MEPTQRSPHLLATIVVLNIILWMILITAIGMGTMHLNDCPVQRKIPVFLIVMGVTGLVCLMLSYIRNTLEDSGISLLCSTCSFICYAFILCWFIAGSKWIYTMYPPNYDPLSKGYCQKRLYLFAFALSCIVDICLSLMIVGGVFLMLVMCTKALLRQTPGFNSYNRMYTEI